jgi:hypothetical protein
MPTGSFTAGANVAKGITSTAAIRRALVQHLRLSAALKASLSGGIHEGFAPAKADYPFLTYDLVYSPIRRQWGSQQYLSGFDIRVFSDDSVVASNIDALVLTVLDDAPLVVAGQSTLLCHRIADLVGPDEDEEGRKVYMVGGTYEVWTDQSD